MAMSPSKTPAVSASAAHLGNPHQFVISRTNDRDLKFEGWKLSREEESLDAGQLVSHTEVTIYVTKAGAIVTSVRRWRENADAKVLSDKVTTGVHHSALDALQWLKHDNNLVLGSVSKKAWVAACRAYPDLKDEEFEQVS
jgi:hypothetical protein